MPVTESIGRRQCIPIIYTRGTHYEVGFDVGRTFASLIKNIIESSDTLNKEYIPAYETPEGRKNYEDTLTNLKINFPQYVNELEGTADGAQVPFYKLFLFHMDNIILADQPKKNISKQPNGCSTICVNNGNQQILCHSEDALKETLNNFYIVSAHIISDKPQGRWQVKEEKFTSLCYAGHLPGYTMGYNHHGLVFTINTISNTALLPGKTPRHFLTRSLLAAQNFMQVQEMLRDRNTGAADACSVNLTFLLQEGDRLFHNAEMAPALNSAESQLNILTASPGEHLLHCNEFIRIPSDQDNEIMLASSRCRMETFKTFDAPKSKEDVIKMIGDESHRDHTVFRKSPDLEVVTIAVGIFDCVEKTWALYADNPKQSAPLVVIPLELKNQ